MSTRTNAEAAARVVALLEAKGIDVSDVWVSKDGFEVSCHTDDDFDPSGIGGGGEKG